MEQGTYVAKSLEDYLNRHPEIDNRCTRNGSTEFLTTEHPSKFEEHANIFLNEKINVSHTTIDV